MEGYEYAGVDEGVIARMPTVRSFGAMELGMGEGMTGASGGCGRERGSEQANRVCPPVWLDQIKS